MEFNHRVNNNSITFINTYEKENPMMKIDEECYFLFTNIVDFHLQLIGKGIIRQDKFTVGLNKHYYIELTGLYDDEKILENFLFPRQVALFNCEDLLKIPKYPKLYTLGNNWKSELVTKNFFKIEGFFVRKTLNQIVQVRQEFCEIIKDDLQKQIKEINLITL